MKVKLLLNKMISNFLVQPTSLMVYYFCIHFKPSVVAEQDQCDKRFLLVSFHIINNCKDLNCFLKDNHT